MKLIIKILGWILLGIISILLIGVLIMYRRDLTLESLEDPYFTEESHYYEATITDLEGEVLTINIHYQDHGPIDGKVIVLLHGAFASSHTFIPWAETLKDEGYRVILIDLPYHGLSDGFSDQVTSLRRSAAVVKDLLDHLSVERLFIGGNSMGGGVSWYFAGTYAQTLTIDGLILIDAIYPSSNSGRPGGLFDLVSKEPLASLISKMTPRFLLKSILQGVYGSESNITDETVDRYYDLLRKEGHRKSILINTQEPFTSEQGIDLLEEIKDIAMPVLLIWGEEDTWIPVETVELFTDTLVLDEEHTIIYDGLGHVPMEEDPERTVMDLLDFLEP